MTPFFHHLTRRARKLQRETGSGVLIVGVEPVAGGTGVGGQGVAVAVAGLSGAEIERAAHGLLTIFQGELIENARDCVWCAERLARVTAALSALDAGGSPDASTPAGHC